MIFNFNLWEWKGKNVWLYIMLVSFWENRYLLYIDDRGINYLIFIEDNLVIIVNYKCIIFLIKEIVF